MSSLIAKEYKLEVIADSDGHKDYKTILTEDIREIKSISPNPAHTQTTIKYLIDNGDSAMITLTHTTNGTYFNYILDSTTDTATIDLLNLNAGQYVVNLISNGLILDAKNLIIN